MFISNKIKFIDLTNENKKDSFYCNICTNPLISFKDFIKYEEYEACDNCFIKFVESRKKEWKDGWRPSKKEIKEYIYIRNQINKTHLR